MDQIEQLEKEARARKAARERAAAEGKNIQDDPAVKAHLKALVAKSKGDNENPDTPDRDTSNMLVPAIQGPTEDLQNILADSFTRGLSTKAVAFLKGNNVDSEKQEVENAKARMGRAGDVAGFVGDVAPYAYAAGPSLVSSAIGGGVVGGADAAAKDSMQTGELPSMANVGLGVLTGAGGAALGQVVGKFLGNTWLKLQGELKPGTTPALTKEADEAVNAKLKAMKAAYAQMDDSGVKIERRSLNNLAGQLEREILNSSDANMAANYRIPKYSKYARDAIQTLRDLGNSSGNIPFSHLNSIKRTIGESTRNANYEIQANYTDDHTVQFITKKIDEFLDGLAMNPTGKVPKGTMNSDIIKAVNGLREGNKLYVASQKADRIAAAMNNAQLAEAKGVSFDQAFQNEMQKLVRRDTFGNQPQASKIFDEEDLAAIGKLAQGSETTQMLNMLDKRFGNGLLGDLHRTYAVASRGVSASGARTSAEDLLHGQMLGGPSGGAAGAAAANATPQAIEAGKVVGALAGGPQAAGAAAGSLTGQVEGQEARKRFPVSKVVPLPQ